MSIDRAFSETVIKHLMSISGGHCSITDEEIESLYKKSPASAEILMGLSHLHEDLVYHQAAQKQALESEEQKNQMLEAAVAQANIANKAKSQFLANMSHEIRTPMNGILGMVTMLEDSGLNVRQQQLLSTVKSCGKGLLLILNDILDFSKIESGSLELEVVNFDLHQCINDVLHLSSHAASAKDIELSQFISSNTPHFVQGDVTRISQIIGNILANAVKFTQQGKVSVNVDAKPIDDKLISLIIKVSDTGIGISQADQQKLFKAFSQVDSSTTRKYGGTGLGLSTSASLIALMKGEIQLHSEVEQGTTFTLTIPLLCGPQVAINVEQGDEDDETMAADYPHDILVVEDNLINQTVALAILEKLGYQCDAVNNGQEALDILKQRQYSLIFMDMQMPVMDGLTASKEIIRQYGQNGPNIVAMTANVYAEDKIKCTEAGMVDFIAKPIRIDNICRVLKRFSGDK